MAFQDILHALREGRGDEALALLAQQEAEPTASTDDSQAMLPYLHLWSLLLTEQWTPAFERVLTLDPTLKETTEGFSERRRRPILWFHLGEMACHLERFEEAVGQYRCALTCLEERRMNIPWFLPRVYASLGRAYWQMKLPLEAEMHAQKAFALFAEIEGQARVAMAEVQLDLLLIDLSRGQVEEVISSATSILRHAQDMENDALRQRALSILGQASLARKQDGTVQDPIIDLDVFVKANRTATTPESSLKLLISLMEIKIGEGRYDQARLAGDQARSIMHGIGDYSLRGRVYHLCGLVSGLEHDEHRALIWYDQAIEAYQQTSRKEQHRTLPELYAEQARLYETIHDSKKAMACLKAAIETLL